MKRGSLLAIEGVDGAGKTTQLELLARYLRGAGVEVVETHEPTRGPFGQRIREASRSGQAASPEQELSWFMQDREEHVAQVIVPALAAGRFVLTDRYFLSTAAYQGARGLDAEAILTENERRFPLPDIAFILEIDPAAGLERVHARGEGIDLVFEQAAFLKQVAEGFRRIVRPYVHRLDASLPREAVAVGIQEAVRARLELLAPASVRG